MSRAFGIGIWLLIALSWLTSGSRAEETSDQFAHLLLINFIIAQVDCGQWERDYSGDWLAEGTADVRVLEPAPPEQLAFRTFHFSRVIVNDRASPLYRDLEWFCRAELDGGVGYNETE